MNELLSDQYYFRPRVDERTYETAVKKASFLIENGYIKLTTGYTESDLINTLLAQITSNGLLKPPDTVSITQL